MAVTFVGFFTTIQELFKRIAKQFRKEATPFLLLIKHSQTVEYYKEDLHEALLLGTIIFGQKREVF